MESFIHQQNVTNILVERFVTFCSESRLQTPESRLAQSDFRVYNFSSSQDDEILLTPSFNPVPHTQTIRRNHGMFDIKLISSQEWEKTVVLKSVGTLTIESGWNSELKITYRGPLSKKPPVMIKNKKVAQMVFFLDFQTLFRLIGYSHVWNIYTTELCYWNRKVM